MTREHPNELVPAAKRGERGADVVEFTLVLVIFFAILTAIVALGRALRDYHSVDSSARQATPYTLLEESARATRAGRYMATVDDMGNHVLRIGSKEE